MQWQGYDGGAITTTTLEDAIAKICPQIGINYPQIQGNIKYYDFRYPNATSLVLVVDRIPAGTDTFNFSIPFNVTLYEASWAHYVLLYWNSNTKIDDTTVSSLSGRYKKLFAWGYYEEADLIAGMKHTVSIYGDGWTENSSVAVVFIYSGGFVLPTIVLAYQEG